MVNNNILQPNVSPLIPYQFPQFYQDRFPIYLAFVKAYYAYLEQQGNALYYSRNFLNLIDIDKTLDSFLVYFKEKYFVNIQFNTQADTRQLIKHALDIYRSKGTEQELRLLFQLLFNETPTFYYPKTNIMRLSSGNWFVPTYLELSLSESNILLNQKEIIGITSGAIAFVDAIIRRQLAGGPITDVAYISGLVGNFQTGELIVATDGTVLGPIAPTMVGSLTDVVITSSGNTTNYAVGDLISILSASGSGAVGRVTSVSDTQGLLTITLNDGGYAYTPNATIYISNSVLTVNISNITNSYASQFFTPFEPITQPLATLNFVNSTANNFATGGTLSVYSNSTTLLGNSTILSVTYSNTTAGVLFVSPVTGTVNSSANLLYSASNTVFANIASSNGYINSTATAVIIGQSNITIVTSSTNGTFIPGEDVVQFIDNGAQPLGVADFVSMTPGGVMTLTGDQGVFRLGHNLIGVVSKSTATPSAVNMNLGVSNVSGTFTSLSGAYYTSYSTNGAITLTASGNNDAGFNISNNLLYSETVLINTDLLTTYANVSANAATYGFPANTSANASWTVANAMTFANSNIGKIDAIFQFSQGNKYFVPNFVTIMEPKTYGHQIYDLGLYVTGLSQPFVQGEEITQASSNARAIVEIGSNNSFVLIQNLRFYPNNQITTTSGTSSQIVGSTSGFVANVTSVVVNDTENPESLNANLVTSTTIATGSINGLSVVDSGFGYINGQQVTFGNSTLGIGTGIAELDQQGSGTGLYLSEGGFLSDDTKLYDGNFYQEFSYQIQSSQPLSAYQQILTQLGHPAGFKMFGQVVYKGLSNNTITAQTSNVTITT